MKTVTFAIPSYNVERYLERCLESFCVEEELDRIEIIIVNDGSTDATEEIAKRYVARYPDSFHVVNKENGGHGSGINYAMKLAQGRYFKVIDADDWIFTENLGRYLKALENTEADVVINEFQSIHMVTGKVITFPFHCETPVAPIDMTQFMKIYPQVCDCCTFHGITYRTEMYRSVDFRLTENVFYEDQEYASVYFTCVEQILFLPFVLYQYLVGNGEQSIAYQNQVKRISDIEKVFINIVNFWNENGPFSAPMEELMEHKMAILASSYYATALVKKSDKAEGRKLARLFSSLLQKKRPILLKRTWKKRKTMELMNYLHISPIIYQRILDTSFYQKIKKFWIK